MKYSYFRNPNMHSQYTDIVFTVTGTVTNNLVSDKKQSEW